VGKRTVVNFQVRLPEHRYRWLKNRAAVSGVSIARLILAALRAFQQTPSKPSLLLTQGEETNE